MPSKSSSRYASRLAKTPAHVRLVFILVILAVFLDVIDFSAVNVALPSIRSQFGVSLADVQWVIGAYGITMAGLLMLSGRIGDIYGQKKFFIAGVILFTITSLTGGIAPSFLILVVSRAVQGIGAAISSVTAFSIFVELFPEGKERNKAMGVFVAVISAGFAAGALAGGFLTTFLGWRSVLFINVPIGLAVAVMIQRLLEGDSGKGIERHLDIAGAVSITGGLMLLVYALTVASNGDFSLLSMAVPLAVALALLVGFFIVEQRARAPLLPLELLGRGMVLKVNVMCLIVAAASGGLGLILTVYMQQVLGFSALDAGLGFLPPSLIFFVVGGWGTSWLIDRLGTRRLLILSTASITAGLLLLALVTPGSGYIGTLPGMILWAFGASIGFPALSIAAVAGTRHGEEGLATGLITTSQRIGFPLGLALMLAVSSITDPAADTSTGAAAVLGFDYAFLAAALFSLLALALAMSIRIGKERGLRGVEMGRVEFIEAAEAEAI